MAKSWKTQLPMYATYSRIVAMPAILGLMLVQGDFFSFAAATLFILLSLTDWLDGYWARKYNAESAMGKFMDPIADKILVLGPLILLVELQVLGSMAVILLLARDIFIGGIRSVAAANSVIIAAKPFGKWKTAIQMVALPCLILPANTMGFDNHLMGEIGIWVSVGLSLLSGAQYTKGYWASRQN